MTSLIAILPSVICFSNFDVLDKSDNDYNPKEDRQTEKRLGQERKESEEKVKVKKAYKRKCKNCKLYFNYY